jgi:outer membrane protein TolC
VFVFTPTSGIREQIYSTYAATFSLQQTIFDFGRTISRVSAGDDLVEAATMDDAAGRNTLIMNVELAYFAVMEAGEVVTVDEEALQAATRHLTQANGFYSVGRRPQLDVKKAEVDLANANVNLISARNALRLARVQLENAMGVQVSPATVVRDALPQSVSVPPLDSLRQEALTRRPELTASRARLSASSSLITAAWTQHLPILSASGTYTWSNFNVDPLYPRWIAAVTLSVPIFQGFGVDAQVQQAHANEEIVRAGYDQLMHSALLEVEQNYLQLQEAQERLMATAKLVEEADDALVLAERQ